MEGWWLEGSDNQCWRFTGKHVVITTFGFFSKSFEKWCGKPEVVFTTFVVVYLGQEVEVN